MKYYVKGIEQTFIDGVYNEYAATNVKKDDFKSAEVYFLGRLAELRNSPSHVFAQLRIENSKGANVVEPYTIGEYVDTDAVEE